MRVIRLTGPPRERGLQYGADAAAEIAECVAVYTRWFDSFAGLPWERARELGGPYLQWLRADAPSLAEEMEGIADGADVPVGDVVALNFRTEIAYGASGLMAASECTSFGVAAESTASGSVYLAENWDWLDATLPLAVMLDIEHDGGRLVTVTEAGMVAKFGMNSHGVGLCVNLLGSDVNTMGGSFHTLARQVLESHGALDAVWSVTGRDRAGSGNFVIGSSSGEVVDLEYNPLGYALHFPERGFVAHANHFLTPQPGLRDRLQVLPSMSPGSYFRQHRAELLMARAATASGGVTVESVVDVLSDHLGAPEGICRHGGPVGRQQVLGRTNVSVVMDLTLGTMHLAHGHACSQDYEKVVMPWAAA